MLNAPRCNAAAPEGLSVTEADVFSALDLDRPELAAVKAATGRG